MNTAAHTICATVAGAQFEVLFGNTWLLAFSLFFTYLMLQFTEILPKTLGGTVQQVSFDRRCAAPGPLGQNAFPGALVHPLGKLAF